jgi:UDP-N-acetylglucosamine 2-epimerase
MVKICFVLHPNPEIKKIVDENLEKSKNIFLIPPQRYDKFLRILGRSNIVVTDSGGVSEETAMLEIPTLITRKVTERQFLVDAGYAELVGNSEELIRERVLSYLTEGTIRRKRNSGSPIDGSHSRFIAHLLVENILPSLKD